MRQICLLILIGLPAAGKTTWVKWMMENDYNFGNIIHICYDDLLNYNIVKPTLTETTKIQRQKLLMSLKELIIQLKAEAMDISKFNYKLNNFKLEMRHFKICKSNNDVIIICDDNHYYRSMRYKLYQLAQLSNIGYGQIYWPCDLNTSLARNIERPLVQQVPTEIIYKMCTKFEQPLFNDHHWEKNTLISKADQSKYEIVEFIQKILKQQVHTLKPLKSQENEKQNNFQSLQHQLDLMLRKRIGYLLKETYLDSTERNKKAMILNNRRKIILKNFNEKLVKSLSIEKNERDLKAYADTLL